MRKILDNHSIYSEVPLSPEPSFHFIIWMFRGTNLTAMTLLDFANQKFCAGGAAVSNYNMSSKRLRAALSNTRLHRYSLTYTSVLMTFLVKNFPTIYESQVILPVLKQRSRQKSKVQFSLIHICDTFSIIASTSKTTVQS
jgi:hypothetical protein